MHTETVSAPRSKPSPELVRARLGANYAWQLCEEYARDEALYDVACELRDEAEAILEKLELVGV